jgi:hypothetical protein
MSRRDVDSDDNDDTLSIGFFRDAMIFQAKMLLANHQEAGPQSLWGDFEPQGQKNIRAKEIEVKRCILMVLLCWSRCFW